jgi:imidazolonepropionase-like amidohydrolase
MADFDKILAQLAASGGVGNAQEGPTRADAAAVVDNIYQQLLGRSAVGTELNQAISMYMANEGGTGGQGNIEQFVKSTNEFQAKSENKYLDAIYNQLARDVRGAQG